MGKHRKGLPENELEILKNKAMQNAEKRNKEFARLVREENPDMSDEEIEKMRLEIEKEFEHGN
jgi:hypothetical protein